MKNFLYPKIIPPGFIWIRPDVEQTISKVHEWIQPLTNESGPYLPAEKVDVLLVGVPLSRSSISASGASEFPNQFRRSWKYFTTYNVEENIDLGQMTAVDAGDIPMHVTDIFRCHDNILEASAALHSKFPKSKICAIGGDHSITAMMVKGLKRARPEDRIGVLQFDTHFDLRDLTENGPSNGTPVRNLIESGIVKGSDIYNIGLHGFFNTRDLKEYADKQGVQYVTLKQVRKLGVETVVRECLEQLETKVDTIYLTVDMDVLDIAFAPGVPASTPGGMTSRELLEGVQAAGRHPKVHSMDIVCLDPLKDTQAETTVKLGTHVFLSFLTGYWKQKTWLDRF
ncbi:agmatinase family protein [Neobacillus muris]|uniref:agmatinase family protein n=1 Tax=Neobacillus muris TaxID=2941334 RepID=UPI00203FEC14|nr:agmatinase family protein [Neobacillus muris]